MRMFSLFRKLIAVLIVFLGITKAFADEASFPGGKLALKSYIKNTKQYPVNPTAEESKSYEVTVDFVVEKSGRVSHTTVIGAPTKRMEQEARYMVECMPLWTPAVVDKKPIRSMNRVVISYNYKLDSKTVKGQTKESYVFRDTLIEDYRRTFQNGKWIFTYKNGSDILPYSYEYMYHYPDGTVKARHNGKWGLSNCDAEEILPYEYDEIYYYEEGYARVKKGNKWGLVSATGKAITPCRYDTLGLFGMDESFGDVFDEEYYSRCAHIQDGANPDNCADSYGVMKRLALAVIDGKYGFVNKQGKEIVSCSHDMIRSFCPGYIIFEKEGKKGLYNDLGRIVVSSRYDDMWYFSNRLAVVKSGNLMGLIDAVGQSILPCKFDTVASFAHSNETVIVRQNKKYGLYDVQGMPLMKCEYDTIFPDSLTRNMVISYKGSEKTKTSVLFEAAACTSLDIMHNLKRYEKNGKWGFLMPDSATVYVVAEYDDIEPYYRGNSIVKKNGKYGMINCAGRLFVPIIYDYINPYSDGRARVMKDGKFGFLNEDGNLVGNIEYGHAYPYIGGSSLINKTYCIDKDGKKTDSKAFKLVTENGGKCKYVEHIYQKAFPGYDVLKPAPGDLCK